MGRRRESSMYRGKRSAMCDRMSSIHFLFTFYLLFKPNKSIKVKIYHLAILSIFFFVIVFTMNPVHSGAFKVSAYYHIEIIPQVLHYKDACTLRNPLDTQWVVSTNVFLQEHLFRRSSMKLLSAVFLILRLRLKLN